MGSYPYRYSLRRGDQILATGHFLSERRLQPGDELTIGTQRGVVTAADPSLGSPEEQLTVELDDRERVVEDDIARRAFELSLDGGEATPEENWLRAERQLRYE